MGYSHMFYALDVEKLKGLFGSKDDALLKKILESQKAKIRENDAFFEDEIAEGEVPDTATAIRQIIYGNPQMDAEGAVYCYALKIICKHLGKMVRGGEYGVANVADHPYDSLLMQSGIPVPIPEPSDFPVVGYLTLQQIDDEIALATAEHDKVASDSAEVMSALRSLFGLSRAGISPEGMQEDIDAYVDTLRKVKKKGKGVVSFRH